MKTSTTIKTYALCKVVLVMKHTTIIITIAGDVAEALDGLDNFCMNYLKVFRTGVFELLEFASDVREWTLCFGAG